MSESNIWDTKLVDDGEDHSYPVADPGTYSFEVEDFKASEYKPKPTSKIGPCAEFNLTLRVEGKVNGENKDVKVFDRLYSDPATAWKITQFAKCVGIFHDGMTLREFYKKAPGTIGKVKIGQRTYNDKLQNEVKEYIVPDDKADLNISDDDLPF